jgi:hypothetical protein
MPMKSQAQRGFLWAKKPKIAAKMEKDTPKGMKGKKLPYHVKKKKTAFSGLKTK